MKAADLMRAGDYKDVRIRREAFAAIAQFASALEAFSDSVHRDETWGDEKVVEAARAAVIYLADDLRSEIDRALGIFDLRDELLEALGERITLSERELVPIAALAILRATYGLPASKEWPSCVVCGARNKGTTWTLRDPAAGPFCWEHYTAEGARRKKAAEDAANAEIARDPKVVTNDEIEAGLADAIKAGF